MQTSPSVAYLKPPRHCRHGSLKPTSDQGIQSSIPISHYQCFEAGKTRDTRNRRYKCYSQSPIHRKPPTYIENGRGPRWSPYTLRKAAPEFRLLHNPECLWILPRFNIIGFIVEDSIVWVTVSVQTVLQDIVPPVLQCQQCQRFVYTYSRHAIQRTELCFYLIEGTVTICFEYGFERRDVYGSILAIVMLGPYWTNRSYCRLSCSSPRWNGSVDQHNVTLDSRRGHCHLYV